MSQALLSTPDREPIATTVSNVTTVSCSFTIDVEDWYQSSVDFDAPITDRVVRNVDRVIEVLDACQVKGTFFVQGRVAETFPRMLQNLLAEGHEVQSHGYSHRPLFKMDRAALRNELEKSRKTIEDACGTKVTSFRAPDFSIIAENLWALETLAELGFEVDSSIFPMKMRRYGVAGWEHRPRRVPLNNGLSILEVPVAICTIGKFKFPVAGGGYFRLLPLPFLRKALASILASGQPGIIYCHPYEFSPEELQDYKGKVSPWFLLKQGLGRESFVWRVRELLQQFNFQRFDRVIEGLKLA